MRKRLKSLLVDHQYMKFNKLTSCFILWMISIMLFSCQHRDAQSPNETVSMKPTSNVSIHKVQLSSLVDSLKPNMVHLADVPPAIEIDLGSSNKAAYLKFPSNTEVPKAALTPLVKHSLPCSVNDKGELILDDEGQPILLGYGGKSHFTSYTTNDGLAMDGICCSTRDRLGNLWFGTFGAGATRYDGKSFVTFTSSQGLGNNLIHSIIEDHQGRLWFGTDEGVSMYDGVRFTTFTEEDGLTDNQVFCLLEDVKGTIWMGTLGGGLMKFENNSFSNYTTKNGLVGDAIHSLFEDESGAIWIGTTSGVSCFRNGTFTNYTTHDGLPSNEIRDIASDSNRKLWFSTPLGISCFDGKGFKNYTTNDGLVNNDSHSIYKDSRGDVWFATIDGVSRFHNNTFTNFTSLTGFAKGSINSIVEDKIGNLWFGTYMSGIIRYDGEAFINYTSETGISSCSANSFSEDKSGNVWFGTNCQGAIRFDGKSYTCFGKKQGLGSESVFSVFSDHEGNVWFGTYGGGVSKFDGKKITRYTTEQGLSSNVILCLAQDSKGNLWFGAADGSLCSFDGKNFITYPTKHLFIGKTIRSIYVDKNDNIWLGIYGGGASMFDGKSFTTFTKENGLCNNEVWSISQASNGNMWFATSGGLSVLSKDLANKIFSGKKNSFSSSQLFSNFNMSDGLPDDFVTNVIQLSNGKTAIGTNLGISIFKLSDDQKQLVNIETYNSSLGFPVKDVNVGNNAMFCDSKGIIWAGTGSEKTAIVRFNYKALNKNVQQPSLVLQSVKVNDESICWYNLTKKDSHQSKKDSLTSLLQEFIAYGTSDLKHKKDTLLTRFNDILFDSISKFYPLPKHLVLPFEKNQISFDFVAIVPSNGEEVYYQYMLEGYSKDWSPITHQTNAVFGNISEGNYVFKVKALGANGVWTSPISYTFEVMPPWYRTWWAYSMYVIFFVIAFVEFSKRREQKLRQEKEKLEKTVEERTIELVQKNILVEKQKSIVEQEKKRSDDLLLNILPEEVAEELKLKGSADAKQFDQVTVLFTDFQDFTVLSEKLSAKELVEEINTCFMAFDKIIDQYGIEKIKTIGDSYMCAGGLPTANDTNAEDVIRAAFKIQEFMQQHIAERIQKGQPLFRIRIGIHTGPVVAGIVGIRKFAYDIWGDTVNTASRMESSGEAGKINISHTTYLLVKDKFRFDYRGKIKTKGKGEMDMYFVENT